MNTEVTMCFRFVSIFKKTLRRVNGHNRVDSSQTGAKGGRVRTKLDLNVNSRIYRWNRSCSLYHSTAHPLSRVSCSSQVRFATANLILSSSNSSPNDMQCKWK